MKIDFIEHVDDFEGELVIYLQLSDPSKELENKAKQIDQNNYLSNCFGACFVKCVETAEINIIEEFDMNVYYIDNEGDKHYLEKAQDDFEKEMIEYIAKEV